MNIKNTVYFSFFLGIFFTGCFHKENTATYFGGKIINPKSEYVILYAKENIIDTLFLDSENKFLGKYETFNEGLYYFSHGFEHQYIYLEDKDSIILRLNTWDFDESLVYSGKGGGRNNLLMDAFLENEKEEKLFYKLNQLQPVEFKQKTDSIIALKNNTFSNYIVKNPNETLSYKNILKISLTYPIFSRIETYPMAHTIKKGLKDFPETTPTFYDFRKNVIINNTSLIYYYPYSNYVRNYLYNATYAEGHKPMENEFSSNFTTDLLKIIHQKIASEEIRNAFLRQTTIEHFYKKSSCDINQKSFDTFFKLSTNKVDKKIIQLLLDDNSYLQKGTKINDFKLNDLNNTPRNIKEVLGNENSFLIFWNPKYISKSYIASKVNFLSSKFPKIQFIQIKIAGDLDDYIQNIDIKMQYSIDAASSANKFLTSKMVRSVLVNKKGIVTNGFASLSSPKIVQQVEELDKN